MLGKRYCVLYIFSFYTIKDNVGVSSSFELNSWINCRLGKIGNTISYFLLFTMNSTCKRIHRLLHNSVVYKHEKINRSELLRILLCELHKYKNNQSDPYECIVINHREYPVKLKDVFELLMVTLCHPLLYFWSVILLIGQHKINLITEIYYKMYLISYTHRQTHNNIKCNEIRNNHIIYMFVSVFYMITMLKLRSLFIFYCEFNRIIGKEFFSFNLQSKNCGKEMHCNRMSCMVIKCNRCVV